ncbi:MAG: DUF4402 domain-containing protein [Sphingomonadales bacterium]|nr:DUF4402 domain-containing protein [Sphingomonadales bacterium]
MNWGTLASSAPAWCLRRAATAVLAAFPLALISAPAQAQTVTSNAVAQAVIVEPASLVKVRDLDFGGIAAQPTAGTVTVNPNTGACTATGGVISVGNCGYAEFGGQGVRRMRMRITLPTTITLTGPGGATMTANTFTLGLAPDIVQVPSPGNSPPRYEIASNSGIFTFRVGARLNVGTNQPPGVYNGNFVVTVQYQ